MRLLEFVAWLALNKLWKMNNPILRASNGTRERSGIEEQGADLSQVSVKDIITA